MRRLVSLRAPSSFRFAPPVVAARSNLKSKPSPVPRRSSSRVASSSSRRAHRALDRVLRSREVPHVPRHRARRPTPRRRLPRAARRSPIDRAGRRRRRDRDGPCVRSVGRSSRRLVSYSPFARRINTTRRSRRFVAYRGRVARHLYFFFRRKRV